MEAEDHRFEIVAFDADRLNAAGEPEGMESAGQLFRSGADLNVPLLRAEVEGEPCPAPVEKGQRDVDGKKASGIEDG